MHLLPHLLPSAKPLINGWGLSGSGVPWIEEWLIVVDSPKHSAFGNSERTQAREDTFPSHTDFGSSKISAHLLVGSLILPISLWVITQDVAHRDP